MAAFFEIVLRVDMGSPLLGFRGDHTPPPGWEKAACCPGPARQCSGPGRLGKAGSQERRALTSCQNLAFWIWLSTAAETK